MPAVQKAQIAKENLRTAVEKFEAEIEKVRAEAKEDRQALRAAKCEIGDLQALIEELEQRASQDQHDHEEVVARLQERIDVERNGRLEARARVDHLERPILQAQTAWDEETEERVCKLTKAVERYRADKLALEAEIVALKAELARHPPSQEASAA